MTRRVSILALVLLVTFLSSAAALAEDTKEVLVYVDGEKVDFPDQEPYIDENNRTLVPVRFPAQTLEAVVNWIQEEREVDIYHEGWDRQINLWIGDKTYKVNGEKLEMDTVAVLTEARTMVPLRFISEALKVDVDWRDLGEKGIVFNFTSEWMDKHGESGKEDKIQKIVDKYDPPVGEGVHDFELTQSEIDRLRSMTETGGLDPNYGYPEDIKTFDEYEEEYGREAAMETVALLEGAMDRRFKDVAEYKFFTDPSLVFINSRSNRASRGVLFVKYHTEPSTGMPEGLELGKTYKIEVDRGMRYSKLKEGGYGWATRGQVDLTDYELVEGGF